VRQSIGQPALRKEVEAGLAGLLGGEATFEAKRFACQQLAVIGAEASVPALATLLKNSDTVGIACLALANNPSPKASAALRDALPALQGAAKAQVINTLGARLDAAAIKAMIGLARDTDVTVAEAAIAALGKIADAPARKVIAELRASTNPLLRRAAYEASFSAAERDRKAAARIYEELLKPIHPIDVRRGALAAILRHELDRDGGQQRILNILRGKDSALKAAAIANARAPGVIASAKLGAELPKLQPQEQIWCIQTLADRGDSDAIQAVRAQLGSPDTSVRLAAIAAVGRWHAVTSTVGDLTTALDAARTAAERQAVETALVSLPLEQTKNQEMLDAMKAAASPESKSVLISALARRGSRVAVPTLLSECGSTNPVVAKAAFQALGKLATNTDLPALLEKLVGLRASQARSTAEEATREVILNITNTSARTEVVVGALAKTSGLDARGSLLRLLPSCGDANAFAALKTACDDANPSIKDIATRTLTEWPDARAWDALAGVYGQPANEAHRVLALRALVRLTGEENARPDANLIQRYSQLLAGAKSDDDRRLILGALSGAAHPDALQLALPLLSNPGVRAEAELAVKKIAEAITDKHPQPAQKALQQLKDTKP
jgi:HEAT repeat protein